MRISDRDCDQVARAFSGCGPAQNLRTPTVGRAGARGWVFAATLVLGLVVTAGTARAQRTEPAPRALEGVGIVDRAGVQVPLDLEFTAEDGRAVRLAQLIKGQRPVILDLGYYECPMLCGLVLQGLVDGMKGLRWNAGRDFDVVVVSINPAEDPPLAMKKKQDTLGSYARPGAAAGWHFLVGREPQIRRLAEAVGFKYRWDETTRQFVHAAGVFVLTPEGKVARTLYGVSYDAKTLRLALTEAGKGTVGGTGEQLLLYCCRYDPNAGTYVVAASKVMRLGGIATALIVGTWLGLAWMRGGRKKRSGGSGRA